MSGSSQFVSLMAHFLVLFLAHSCLVKRMGNKIVSISPNTLFAEIGESSKIILNKNFPLIQLHVVSHLFPPL